MTERPRKYRLDEIIVRTVTLEGSINLSKEMNLIHTRYRCTTCITPDWCIERPFDCVDGFRWECPQCRKHYPARIGSFFEDMRKPMSVLIRMVYYYAVDTFMYKTMNRELHISRFLHTDFRGKMRYAKLMYLADHSTARMGGVGHHIQCDETVFGGAGKYGKGRLITAETWVAGGIDVDTNDIFMSIVARRDRGTLIPLIQKHVVPGSTVITDLWAGYWGLQHYGYTHYAVNHSNRAHPFVDPRTGAHTNSVENMWMLTKRRHKVESGTSRTALPSYLEEFIWKRKFKDEDPMASLLKTINYVFPTQ